MLQRGCCHVPPRGGGEDCGTCAEEGGQGQDHVDQGHDREARPELGADVADEEEGGDGDEADGEEQAHPVRPHGQEAGRAVVEEVVVPADAGHAEGLADTFLCGSREAEAPRGEGRDEEANLASARKETVGKLEYFLLRTQKKRRTPTSAPKREVGWALTYARVGVVLVAEAGPGEGYRVSDPSPWRTCPFDCEAHRG